MLKNGHIGTFQRENILCLGGVWALIFIRECILASNWFHPISIRYLANLSNDFETVLKISTYTANTIHISQPNTDHQVYVATMYHT